MPKQYRKELSFQSGEISPKFFGRSETEVYDNGLAIAENVFIDKRGGAFKRKGLAHKAQTAGNNARLFGIQASRTRFYTILITDSKMTIIAPGASMIGTNLLSNGNFAEAGTNWSTTVTPASSRVVFRSGECDLLPEQNNPELVANGEFLQGDVSWSTTVDNQQSTVTFANEQCVLAPRQNAAGFARIFQQLTTTLTGTPHKLTIDGDYVSGDVHVQVGTGEADGTYLDTVLSPVAAKQLDELTFTPAASPFTVTLSCENPNLTATITTVSVEEPIAKTSQISQQATVVAADTDIHNVVVSQLSGNLMTINIGTTEGASDIATLETTALEAQVEFTPNNPTYWVSVLSNGDDSIGTRLTYVGTAAAAVSDGIGFEMTAPWNEDQLDEIHIIESPNGESYYFTHPNVPVQKLVYNYTNDTFVDLTDTVFTNPIKDSGGSVDLWTGTNHPSTGTFFQGRLWFGATPGQPQTFWGSYSGSPEDFLIEEGGTPVPTAATAVILTLREYGTIEWMLGTKNLLIGTENGEHIVTSDGGVITPLDFDIKQQSSFGSNNMQSIQVGEKVFYLTPDSRKLQAMSYQWDEDNWLSQDLTFSSDHVTIPLGKYSGWVQHPGNLFQLVLEDGTLASLTYDRTAKTIAWSRQVFPGFHVIDITVGKIEGVNHIVLVGQRSTGVMDIETVGEVGQYLDSYVEAYDVAGTNTITGLDHLEGLYVRPIVDGAVEPEKVVVAGQITTVATGNQLYAGIGYTAKIKTLAPDSPQAQIRSFKKRWNKVWALVLEGKAPIINGVRPPDRTPSTPMGEVEPNISGHFKTVNLGWDDFGQITIEEPLPVAMNILAIYGEMAAETL